MTLQGPIGAVTGRRRDSRLRLAAGLPARLVTLHGQHRAVLLDLSQSGAHLQCRTSLGVGEDLVLWWLGFEAFGTVVWAQGNQVGLEFDELLPIGVLLQTREQVDLGIAPTASQHEWEEARNWYLTQR